MATMSAREFNQDVSAAKRAAETEPLVITDRGLPSHVLITYREYVERFGSEESVFDRLSVGADFEFEVDRLDFELRMPEL